MNYKYHRPCHPPKGSEGYGLPSKAKPKHGKSEQSLWNENSTKHLLSEYKLLFLLMLLPIVMGIGTACVLEPQVWLLGQPSNRDAVYMGTHTFRKRKLDDKYYIVIWFFCLIDVLNIY